MNKLATVEAEASPLSAAMAKAFAEIEGATKDKVNPHFKSKYADLGSVIAAIKPALANHGLFFTQASHVVDDGVCVETIIHHASGEARSCGKIYVPANKRDAQGFGSALTYARRYGLMTAFGVPAEDDDGNAAARSYNGGEVREKVNGIQKIKDRLRIMRDEADRVDNLEQFNAHISAHKDDLTAIKEANHEWWTGDGADSEGFKVWIIRRRSELMPVEESETYTMCMDTLNACESTQELNGWFKLNWRFVEELDGAERDQVEARYQELETSLNAVDTVSVG